MKLKHIHINDSLTSHSTFSSCSGFSLIEVLVTVVVMSVGLLGIAGMQLTSLKNNDSSYISSKSALYSYNLIDYMRANRGGAITGQYNIGLSSFNDLIPPSGSSSIAEVDRYNWFQQLEANLPDAKAAINCDANAVCVVKVQWDDSHAEGSVSTRHIVLSAQL